MQVAPNRGVLVAAFEPHGHCKRFELGQRTFATLPFRERNEPVERVEW